MKNGHIVFWSSVFTFALCKSADILSNLKHGTLTVTKLSSNNSESTEFMEFTKGKLVSKERYAADGNYREHDYLIPLRVRRNNSHSNTTARMQNNIYYHNLNISNNIANVNEMLNVKPEEGLENVTEATYFKSKADMTFRNCREIQKFLASIPPEVVSKYWNGSRKDIYTTMFLENGFKNISTIINTSGTVFDPITHSTLETKDPQDNSQYTTAYPKFNKSDNLPSTKKYSTSIQLTYKIYESTTSLFLQTSSNHGSRDTDISAVTSVQNSFNRKSAHVPTFDDTTKSITSQYPNTTFLPVTENASSAIDRYTESSTAFTTSRETLLPKNRKITSVEQSFSPKKLSKINNTNERTTAVQINHYQTTTTITDSRPKTRNETLKSIVLQPEIQVNPNSTTSDTFTDDEIKKILELHNFYRRTVKPPAGNMKYLVWNKTLQNRAQEWVNKCRWGHGGVLKHRSFPMGQNLYRGPKNIKFFLDLWNSEKDYFNYKDNSCSAPLVCRNYTQITWATTQYVGCGIKSDCFGNTFKYYIACNYYPHGNVPHKKPYKIGSSCSLCPTKDQFCTGNLCVSDNLCRNEKLNCSCKLRCVNCGLLDPLFCKCWCKDGWTSPDCSTACVNQASCRKEDCKLYKDLDPHPCGETCNKCREIKNRFINTCCKGAFCKPGYVIFNRKSCQCELLCPGPECSTATQMKPMRWLSVIGTLIIFMNIILSSEQ